MRIVIYNPVHRWFHDETIFRKKMDKELKTDLDVEIFWAKQGEHDIPIFFYPCKVEIKCK